MVLRQAKSLLWMRRLRDEVLGLLFELQLPGLQNALSCLQRDRESMTTSTALTQQRNLLRRRQTVKSLVLGVLTSSRATQTRRQSPCRVRLGRAAARPSRWL